MAAQKWERTRISCRIYTGEEHQENRVTGRFVQRNNAVWNAGTMTPKTHRVSYASILSD